MTFLPRIRAAVFSLVLMALALSAAPALAREATVTLNDGKTYTGEVVSDDAGGVVLLIANIRTTIPREDVKSVEYIETIESQYATRRAAIADDNIGDRLVLARWLYENKAYTLAKKEVDDLKTRAPDDTQIDTLGRAIEARLKLMEDSAKTAADKAPKPADKNTPSPKPGTSTDATVGPPGLKFDEKGLPTERLSDKEINTIRVYEVDLRSNPRPRVIVPKSVVDDVLTGYSDRENVPKGKDQQKFRSAPGVDQLQLLFDLKARELYDQVTVKDDPAFIKNFTSNIHRAYVLNYCGTSSCHGGENGGRMFLFRNEGTSDRTIYTNFYTLAKFETAKGYMIDMTKPERSFLIQYGLPVEEAALPHPTVKGWQPFARNINNATIQVVLRWISTLSTTVNFKYPIAYTPAFVLSPEARAAAARGATPATTPAPMPTPAPTPEPTPEPPANP